MENITRKHQEKYRAILSAINRYQKIAIFRHIHPDFDALGAAWALKEFIHDNYMDKDVKVLGDNHEDFTPRLFSKTDRAHNEWFNEPFLAIVVDTPNKRRISDPRYEHAELIIKIDHHPFMEKMGDIECIEEQVSSACELIADMLINSDMKVGPHCARALYIGVVGDSGRFEYSNTSEHTFAIAKNLIATGLDLNEIYHNMYLRSENDLKVIAYILNKYQVSKKGVAYYILTRKELEQFHISTSQGKDHVNLFHFVDSIKIWCAITEDMKENCFRISIRSEKIDVHEVAAKYRGGGHANASGARIFSLSEVPDFINDLDKLIK